MTDKKRLLKACALFFAAALIIEIFGFNFGFFASRTETPEAVSLVASDGLERIDKETYAVPELNENAGKNPYFEITDINKKTNYIRLDMLTLFMEEPNCVAFDVYATDEGSSAYYYCNTVVIHPSLPSNGNEKTKYFKVHTYGKAKSIRLVFNKFDDMALVDTVKIGGAEINAKVPMFFSPIRVLLIVALLLFIYMFRPSSSLYRQGTFTEDKKLRLLKTAFMGINIIIFALLLCNNLTYANPSNDQYRQYNLLAEAIAQGRVNIDVTNGELMKQVLNPYDINERLKVLAANNLSVVREPWLDIAYFNDNFYVYFGIVPELIFYLPVYLIAKTHMVTSGAVFIVCCLTVLSAYKLVETLVKVYFPKTSYGASLLASIILANCCGTLSFIMSPIIYNLVILCAVMFAFIGLNFWMSAKYLIDNEPASKKINIYILLGSLSMALTAGCRPPIVLCSLLIIPIFWDTAIQHKKIVLKGNIAKYLCVIIPYALVAAGLMYYNYIRFGSPLDFGSDYNLTTNNLAMRGTELAKIPDGLFMYFFQFPIVSLSFPFVHTTLLHTAYNGMIYAESFYGGLMFTAPFTCLLFAVPMLKKTLKRKKLFALLILIIVISVLTACLETELGGFISRYAYDFVYLLIFGAVIVMLALYEKYPDKKSVKNTVLTLGVLTLAFMFIYTFVSTSYQAGTVDGYFTIYNMFN